MKKLFKDKTPLILILLLGFLLRILYINSKGFSSYEAESAIIASKPFFILLLLSLKGIHPPLYYFLLHFWSYLGNEEVLLRIFSIFWGLGVILMIYFLAIELFTREIAIISSFFTAILPGLIFFSQDVSPFVFGIFATQLSLLYWYKFFYNEEYSLKKWVIFFSLLSIYSLHTSVIIFIGQILWVYYLYLSKKTKTSNFKHTGRHFQQGCDKKVDWKINWKLCKNITKTVTYYFSPGIIFILLQIPNNIFIKNFSCSKGSSKLYVFPFKIVEILLGTQNMNFISMAIIFFFITIILLWTVFKSNQEEKVKIGYLFFPFLISFIFLNLFNIFLSGKLNPAILSSLSVFIILLWSFWISHLNKKIFKLTLISLIAVFMSFKLYAYYKKDYKEEKWKEAFYYLENNNLKNKNGLALAYIGFPNDWSIRYYININAYDYIFIPSIEPIILGIDEKSPFYSAEQINYTLLDIQKLFKRHKYVWVIKNIQVKKENLPKSSNLRKINEWLDNFCHPVEKKMFEENILIEKCLLNSPKSIK